MLRMRVSVCISVADKSQGLRQCCRCQNKCHNHDGQSVASVSGGSVASVSNQALIAVTAKPFGSAGDELQVNADIMNA